MKTSKTTGRLLPNELWEEIAYLLAPPDAFALKSALGEPYIRVNPPAFRKVACEPLFCPFTLSSERYTWNHIHFHDSHCNRYDHFCRDVRELFSGIAASYPDAHLHILTMCFKTSTDGAVVISRKDREYHIRPAGPSGDESYTVEVFVHGKRLPPLRAALFWNLLLDGELYWRWLWRMITVLIAVVCLVHWDRK